MKKYSTLRRFLKRFTDLQEDYVLKDCPLVIDGDSVFRRTYKGSGCKFILGGEFDRYAYYLKKILTPFIESNVTCYVVFSGAKKLDIERRKKIHQKLISTKISIVPGDGQYYEPVFVKDVIKQVLEELGIKYAVCEYDAYKTLLDVSRAYNCPVLSNNIEICLMFMSCITPDSQVYDPVKKQISCLIRTSEVMYYQQFKLYHTLKPLFMAIIDETGPLFKKIPKILDSLPRGGNVVGCLKSWIKQTQLEEATRIIDNLLTIECSEAEQKTFKDMVDELSLIFHSHKDNFVVRHFKSKKYYDLKTSDLLFRNAVMTGRVAIPYINLRKGTFSGSWVICDQNKRDAMEPAFEIVMCANEFLPDHQKQVTLIKRNEDKTDLEVVKGMHGFFIFIDKVLEDFDWLKVNEVPEESWLLIITLAYCMIHIENFITASYSILLSYVMLGPVSEQVGLIKWRKLYSDLDRNECESNSECTYDDCLAAAKDLVDYFSEGDLKKNFDRSTLHDLAEFQHCLQQMNYLHKLLEGHMWGKEVKCTNYYKTYNGTFVFNVLVYMRRHKTPMAFINRHLKRSPSVLKLYMKLKDVFESFLVNLCGESKCKEQFNLSL